jgi:hypothetical protein
MTTVQCDGCGAPWALGGGCMWCGRRESTTPPNRIRVQNSPRDAGETPFPTRRKKRDSSAGIAGWGLGLLGCAGYFLFFIAPLVLATVLGILVVVVWIAGHFQSDPYLDRKKRRAVWRERIQWDGRRRESCG